MGWIQNHLRKHEGQDEPDASPEDQFAKAARRRWQQLGGELRSDLDEFGSHQKGAAFNQFTENEFRISNSDSGLELLIAADFKAHTIRYAYSAIGDKSAGTPEGGMLAMRQSRRGTVEFYSSDQELTPEQARQVLLEPLLFPPEMAA
jgi:hypothetical protein